MMGAAAALPDTDPVQFLKIAGQGANLATHADLWRWLQGDVQRLLAHDAMLIGWGDFRAGDLHFDIVSSLPGLRTYHCTASGVSPLINYFRDCWVAAQHSPCELDISGCAQLLPNVPGAPSGEAIARMRTALVHGIGDGRHCSDRVFVALSGQPCASIGATSVMKLLLPFIDTALRRMPPAPARPTPMDRSVSVRPELRLAALSEREREIMVWVAMGKTNPEIGCILSISEFTVKNHMKSIFGKLDVTNRAQAVAKVTRMGAYA
jgi:transcriptional regulator EpsA